MSYPATTVATGRTGADSSARVASPPRLRSALAVVAAGGALGALARHGVATVSPPPSGGFPWATFAVNVTGCLLVGILTVLFSELAPTRGRLRLFLTVGVLGGFTTYSTYVLDTYQLFSSGRASLAAAYLLSMVVATWCAVAVGAALAGRVVRARGRSRSPMPGGTR